MGDPSKFLKCLKGEKVAEKFQLLEQQWVQQGLLPSRRMCIPDFGLCFSESKFWTGRRLNSLEMKHNCGDKISWCQGNGSTENFFQDPAIIITFGLATNVLGGKIKYTMNFVC